MNTSIYSTLSVLGALVALLMTSGCEQREPNAFQSSGPSEPTAEAQAGSHAERGTSEAPESEGSQPPASDSPAPQGSPAPSPGAMPQANTGPAPGGQPTGGATTPEWEVPEHWEAYEPSSDMRLANWRLPAGQAEEQGVCAVFQFPGGGDPEANIRRWLGQFTNEAGEPARESAERAELIIDSVPTYLVRTHGTFSQTMRPMGGGQQEPKENYGLFGVVFALNTPIFVKCTGPKEVIDAEEAAITSFIRSFQF